MLYILGVHPFSLLFEKHVCDPRRGLVRQCADDIGALLSSLLDLPILYWVFNLMALVANQILGFSKCVVVPVTGSYKASLVDAIRTHIQTLVPQWGSFKIEPSAEYLGTIMGPNTSQQFVKVESKFQNIVSGIARANSSALLSLLPYTAKATTVFSYKAQILTPPPKTLRTEMHAISRVLHIPSALGYRTPTFWHKWGLPRVNCILDSAKSAMIRFG